jgi:TonB family protein
VRAPTIGVSTVGTVKARVTVDVVGRVETVEVLSDTLDDSFKRAAIAALRGQRFRDRDAGSFDVELVFNLEQPASATATDRGPNMPSGRRPFVKVTPPYPDRAAAECIEGKVNAELTVEPSGQVTQVAILKAQPGGYFEEGTKAALVQWRYPAHDSTGKMHIEVVFMMSEAERANCR